MKESFRGDVYGETKLLWKKQLLEADSRRERDRYAVREVYQRRHNRRQPIATATCERDFVTRLGTLRLRIARTRGKSFLPRGMERFQRRAEEVSMLIREAFLRGISTRQVGRVVATVTEEVVSAQTVSKLTRDLDETVRQFHLARRGRQLCVSVSGLEMEPRSTIRWQHRLKREHPTCTERKIAPRECGWKGGDSGGSA